MFFRLSQEEVQVRETGTTYAKFYIKDLRTISRRIQTTWAYYKPIHHGIEVLRQSQYPTFVGSRYSKSKIGLLCAFHERVSVWDSFRFKEIFYIERAPGKINRLRNIQEVYIPELRFEEESAST